MRTEKGIFIAGCLKSLREYETARQRSNVPKMLAIDLIQKVAGHQFPPLLAATNAAFLATNSLPMLKVCFDIDLLVLEFGKCLIRNESLSLEILH